MKTLRLIFAFMLPILLLGGMHVPAKAFAFTYTSGFQVQNLDNATANITITFYKQDGTIETTVTDTVSPLGSKTYFPLGVPQGFNGSVVISSDRPVAAVSNVGGNNFAASASYVGRTEGSLSVLIPLLMKGNSGFNTWFNVQNTSTSSSATVTVNYSDGTSASAVIQPGASRTFDQTTETHSLSVFSAVVTSDQPVVATVIEESTSVMFAYNGFNAGSTYPVMPLINANNSGYITGVQIQNAGNVDTTVEVTYTPSAAGKDCTETRTIPSGQSVTFALAAFANDNEPTIENCVAGALFIGSARVSNNSTNQPLVAVVNQLLVGRNGEAYGGFDPNLATNQVVLPLIMDRNSGYWTGFNVMNVGTTPTTVNCVFTGTSYTVSAALDPGKALTDLQNGKIGNPYVGSATCTAASGGKIVAIVNELGPSSTADQLLVYEGINP